MEYSHIIIDDSAVPQACQFCRSEAVPDSQGEWVQCDRCFGWYHIPCAAGYDNRAGHDPNDIWLCQSCTVIREREGSLDAKAIVIPMLKLIKDHGLMFADAGHVLAKAVAKGVKAVIRGSVSNGICKSVWKLSGEQNSAVNVLLACNVKCRLQANGKRVGFVDYSKFLSLSVSPIAEDAKKQYDSYLDRNLGALICRGLAIEDLKFVYESRPYDICETAFLEEAREAAANRLRNFLREQGDKHGGQQWDTHELWKLVRRPLQAIIIGGCHAALLSKAQADMSGRPGSIDLLKRLGDFMPDAFIALAQRPTSTAEHILELGGVTYEARCGICADGVAADTCVDIAAPESHTKGAKAIFYRYRLPVEAVCDVCYETRPLSYFEFKFCTCSARICRCCAFRTTIAAHVEGADLRCTSCRQPLDTDDRNVIKLVADTTAFVEVLRSLNPSVPTGPANVVIPDNDFAFTNDVAYDILERIYDHGPTPADDDIAQREIAADYRRQLQLGDDVDDEEVMRRARQAAVEGNPPNSPPDDNMSLASENLDRAWPNDDELEVANGGNDSPIRSGPVSVAGDDLDGPLFVVPDGDGHDILMDIGTPDLVQDGDLISGNDREPFVAADASPSTHTVNSTSLTRAIRGSGALSASPQGTAGVGLISNARIGSGIASRDPGGSENQPSQMGSNPYGRTLPGAVVLVTARQLVLYDTTEAILYAILLLMVQHVLLIHTDKKSL
ncbi:hypothetical protein FOL47_004172 [Perkinsus chesapeaki]|uniref:PHD-type domain-containing protein n=1 Tax=Perkinsus chesapeaki TaxID=330153 RepID=A0A7J6M535_PERCH|nr:hypothetical protein FOL47_004172 [Perkinsus chesapeaki]